MKIFGTRLLLSLVIFAASLIAMTIASTWAWDRFVTNTLYHCTDGVPYDFFDPGNWTHDPVTVQQIIKGRSMSEPDSIKAGWSVKRLWLLWGSFVTVSIFGSVLLAWLPWSTKRAKK